MDPPISHNVARQVLFLNPLWFAPNPALISRLGLAGPATVCREGKICKHNFWRNSRWCSSSCVISVDCDTGDPVVPDTTITWEKHKAKWLKLHFAPPFHEFKPRIERNARRIAPLRTSDHSPSAAGQVLMSGDKTGATGCWSHSVWNSKHLPWASSLQQPIRPYQPG